MTDRDERAMRGALVRWGKVVLLAVLVGIGVPASNGPQWLVVGYGLLASASWGLCGPPGLLRFPTAFDRRLRLGLVTTGTLFACGVMLSAAFILGRHSIWTRLFEVLVAFGSAWFLAARARLWADLPPNELRDAADVRDRLEMDWLKRGRTAMRHIGGPSIKDPTPPGAEASDLVGVALSGGGIRAASLAMGFLSGLAESDLLWRADYLSTVSGGGWAGTLFASSMYEPGELNLLGPGATGWPSLFRAFKESRSYLGRRDYQMLKRIGWIVTRWLASILGLAVLALLILVMGTVALIVATAIWTMEPPYLLRLLRTTLFDFVPGLFPPRADLRGLEVIELASLPFFGFLTAFLACGAACLVARLLERGASRQVRFEPLSRLSMSMARSAAIALFVALLLQGRTVVTACLLAAAAAWVCALVGRPRHPWRAILVIGATTSAPWLADTAYPGLGLVTRLTEGWSSLLWRGLLWVARQHSWLTFLNHHRLDWRMTWSHGRWAIEYTATADPIDAIPWLLLYGSASAALYLLIGFANQASAQGLHDFWMRQIGHAFFTNDLGREALGRSDGAAAPLHILNGAVGVPGSSDPMLRSRGTSRFEMSACAVGGPATGWAPSTAFPALTVAGAAALSAAAISPQSGRVLPSVLRAPFALLNLRLGRWLPNPRFWGDPRFDLGRAFLPELLASEVFGLNDENHPRVYVADGGFEDNLGLSTLIERGCRVVFALDGTTDPRWDLGDLQDLPGVRDKTLAWLGDEGVTPKIPARTEPDRFAHCPVTLLRYRHRGNDVHVFYAKASLVRELFEEGPAGHLATDFRFTQEELAYVRSHPHFPQQGIVNQFFAEAQQSAYIKVGHALALRVVEALAQPGREELAALFRTEVAHRPASVVSP